MSVIAPTMKAQKHGPIRVDELSEIVVRRVGISQAEERLVPAKAAIHIRYADDRPRASHAKKLPIVGMSGRAQQSAPAPHGPPATETACHSSPPRDSNVLMSSRTSLPRSLMDKLLIACVCQAAHQASAKQTLWLSHPLGSRLHIL